MEVNVEDDLFGFLGLSIKQLYRNRIELTKSRLIKRILEAMGIDRAKLKATPAEIEALPAAKLGRILEPSFNYTSFIGMLKYLEELTRPVVHIFCYVCAHYCSVQVFSGVHSCVVHSCVVHSCVVHSCVVHSCVVHSCVVHTFVVHSCVVHSCVVHSCVVHTFIIHSCVVHSCVVHSCVVHTFIVHSCVARTFVAHSWISKFSYGRVYSVSIFHSCHQLW